jgi:hypothetical protein
MSIDDRFRREPERQGSEIDRAGFDEHSLVGMLWRVFTGKLRRWAAFGMLLTLAFVALTVWCGYGFFTATDTGDRVFRGMLALAALQAVSMLKLWFFMEMNRDSVIREVKRMEIALNRLER